MTLTKKQVRAKRALEKALREINWTKVMIRVMERYRRNVTVNTEIRRRSWSRVGNYVLD